MNILQKYNNNNPQQCIKLGEFATSWHISVEFFSETVKDRGKCLLITKSSQHNQTPQNWMKNKISYTFSICKISKIGPLFEMKLLIFSMAHQ